MAKIKTKKLQDILSRVSVWKYWISLAIGLTLMSGLVYLVAQQNLRQAANDPQIQISEDVADNLAQGASAQQIIPNYTFDIGKSLSTFVIVMDDSGKVIATTASLDGKTPQVPKGVLDYAKAHNQNRITWEPRKGLRDATIVTHYVDSSTKTSGFVLVGRSLREVEKRVDQLGIYVAAAWLVSIVATFAITLLFLERKAK